MLESAVPFSANEKNFEGDEMIAVINAIYYLFFALLLGRIIFSWVQVSPYHPTWGPLYRITYETTEPILGPVRNLMPPMGGLDLSPIIVLLLAGALRSILIGFFI
jgi:YggT family protein